MEQCRKNKKSFGRTTVNGVEYRFYRTGDEGYIIDGMLHYCGRIDNQVKLHGYRIELEDIESNLLKIHGIIQAVVLPKYRDGKVSSLVAGVVLSEATEDEKTAAESIKSKLKMTLPEYMIPKKIKFLSNIPRTNNGKIDRKAVGGVFMSFFCRMRFLHGFVYSFDPSGLAGIIREKIKMVQMAPIPVFYLGGIRLNKNTAALSDRLCYFCRIFGKDIFIPSKKIRKK